MFVRLTALAHEWEWACYVNVELRKLVATKALSDER